MRGLLFDGRGAQAIELGEALVPLIDSLEDEELRSTLSQQVAAFRLSALHGLGRFEEVISAFDAIVASQGDAYKPGQLNSANLDSASVAYEILGDLNKARELADRGVRETLQWAGPSQINSIGARERQVALAAVPPETLSRNERLLMQLRLWDDSRRIFGRTNARVIHKEGAIAMLLSDAGRRAEAAVVLRNSLVLRREVFGIEDVNTQWAAWNLAKLLTEDDRSGPFLAECQAQADLARDRYGEQSAEYVGEVLLMATALDGAGRANQALSRIMEVQAAESTLGPSYSAFRQAWADKASGLLHAAGRFAEAQSVVARELEIDPNWARGWQILAWQQRRMGRAVEAEASLHRALTLEPRPNAGMQNDLAVALRDQQRFEEALDEVGIATRLNPTWANSAWLEGMIQMDLNRPEQAVESFRRAVKLAPEWGDPRLRLGVAISRVSGHADAVPHYVEAVRLDSNWAWPAFEAGRAMVELGRFAEAEPYLVHACELDARWGDHWLYLGRALEGMDRPLDAFCAYSDGAIVDLNRDDLRAERDRVWSSLNEPDRTLYEVLESLRREHVLGDEVIRAVDLRSDLSDEIRSRLKELATRRAVTRDSVNNAAWLIVRSPGASVDDYARALSLAREAASDHPRAGWPGGANDANTVNTLGFAFLRAGLHEEAEAEFVRSNSLLRESGQPESPPNWAGLALTYWHLGNAAERTRAVERFRELAADSQWQSDAEVAAFEAEIRAALGGEGGSADGERGP